MPKSRTKSGAVKNIAASTKPIPLLDSLRVQIQSSPTDNTITNSDTDDIKISASGWQCDIDDWSDKNHESDIYPTTLRSLQRKTEQERNKFLQIPSNNTTDSMNYVDISKLSLIVNDLITGKRDESAYADFLSILEHFSVHTKRNDQLEETVYHLIQAAVSFIRSNKQRFDQLKLEECYQRRHTRKLNSTH